MVNVTDELLEKNFKSNPIKDVSLELRFESKFAINTSPEKFQEKYKNIFPKAIKEEVIDSNKYQTTYYKLYSTNSDFIVRYSNSNIVVSNTAYISFKHFESKAKEIFSDFNVLYGVNSYKRVGLRYINNIKINLNNLEHFIDFVLPTINISSDEKYSLDEINSFASQVTYKINDFNLNLMNGYIPPAISNENTGIVIIDIDSFSTNSIAFNNLWEYIYKFKREIKRVYLNTITNKTLKLMEDGVCF